MSKNIKILSILFFISFIGCKKVGINSIQEESMERTDVKNEISGTIVEVKVLEQTKKFTLSSLKEKRLRRKSRQSIEYEDSFEQAEEEILNMVDSIYATNNVEVIQNMENYFEENEGIDISVQRNIHVVEGSLNSNELEYMRTENELNSEINNSFESEDMVEIENSLEELENMGSINENIRRIGVNKLKYHRYDITNRGINRDNITPASLLALYFANTGDYMELEKLKTMFGKNLDLDKIKEKIEKMGKIAGRDIINNARSGGPVTYPTELVAGMNVDPGRFLDDGDIVICNSSKQISNFFIGYWTHSGIFSEDKWNDDWIQGQDAYTVLTANDKNGPEESDRRGQACYDRISVYNNSKAIRVQWPLGWSRALGRLAVSESKKNFYDRQARYSIPYIDYLLPILFNESHKMNGSFAYCSRVAWYGWKAVGKEIECDKPMKKGTLYKPNLIYPENIVNSIYTVTERSCWRFLWWHNCSTRTVATQKTSKGIERHR